MRSTPFCRVFGDGRAQVDTASLGDSNMHGEAEKTETQKARGYCEGAGVDICRRSASEVCAGVQCRVICVARTRGVVVVDGRVHFTLPERLP